MTLLAVLIVIAIIFLSLELAYVYFPRFFAVAYWRVFVKNGEFNRELWLGMPPRCQGHIIRLWMDHGLAEIKDGRYHVRLRRVEK